MLDSLAALYGASCFIIGFAVARSCYRKKQINKEVYIEK